MSETRSIATEHQLAKSTPMFEQGLAEFTAFLYSKRQQQAIRHAIAIVRAKAVPPLQLEDVFGLTFAWIQSRTQRNCLPRSKPVQIEQVAHCNLLALRSVLQADILFAIEAGVLPQLITPSDVTDAHIRRWHVQWHKTLSAAIDKTANPERASARERALYEHWKRTVQWNCVAEGAELIAAVRQGIKAYDREQGRRAPAIEHDDLSMAAELLLLTQDPRDTLRVLFRGRDGQLRVGARQVRDQQGSRSRRGPHEFTFTSVQGSNDGDETPVLEHSRAERDPTPAEIAIHREAELRAVAAVQSVRDVIQARLARPESTGCRGLVLKHFEELAAGTTSCRELALRLGVSHSALSRAWRSEVVTIANDARVRTAI